MNSEKSPALPQVETDAVHDRAEHIYANAGLLAAAIEQALVEDAVPGHIVAIARATEASTTFADWATRVAIWAAKHGQCIRCETVVKDDECPSCAYLDAQIGEDPEHDAETMDEPPGGRLES